MVEVGRDAVEGVDDLVGDLGEPHWSNAASLWHNHPLEETGERTLRGERYHVLVQCYLIKEDTTSKSENIRPVSYTHLTLPTKA